MSGRTAKSLKAVVRWRYRPTADNRVKRNAGAYRMSTRLKAPGVAVKVKPANNTQRLLLKSISSAKAVAPASMQMWTMAIA